MRLYNVYNKRKAFIDLFTTALALPNIIKYIIYIIIPINNFKGNHFQSFFLITLLTWYARMNSHSLRSY